MKKLNVENQLVFITGAGSGIGRATALKFAQEGARLALCDINAAGLDETIAQITAMGAQAQGDILDVSDRAAYGALAEKIIAQHGAPTVLINNAGMAFMGSFLDASNAAWDKAINVNLRGVIHGCQAFLPAMIAANQDAAVINVASMCAFVAAPDLSVYSTTKFAVLGLSESLRGELHQHRISVAAICPGIINTGIIANSMLEGKSAQARDKLQSAYKKRNYTGAQVANAIYKAAIKRKKVVPVSPEAWITYFGKRFTPNISAWISGFVQKI